MLSLHSTGGRWDFLRPGPRGSVGLTSVSLPDTAQWCCHSSTLQFPEDHRCRVCFRVLTCHPQTIQMFRLLKNFAWALSRWALRVPYLFWIKVLYQTCNLQIFSSSLWLILFSYKYFLKIFFIFRARGREGDREGEKRRCVRETLISCPSRAPHPGSECATQACALTGNRTSDLPLCGTTLSQLSHAGHSKIKYFLKQVSHRNYRFV